MNIQFRDWRRAGPTQFLSLRGVGDWIILTKKSFSVSLSRKRLFSPLIYFISAFLLLDFVPCLLSQQKAEIVFVGTDAPVKWTLPFYIRKNAQTTHSAAAQHIVLSV